jgi:hypothetical protein
MHSLIVRYWHLYFGLLVQLAVVIAVCLFAWLVPNFANGWFQKLETCLSRFARKSSALWFALVLPIAVRLFLLPIIGVPLTRSHDESSYLLMADTFVHGRLANPPHPMWRSFETFHVLSFPTYSSIFPPAQGFMLAFGQLLGSPWIGVVLSIGLMCASIVWMLQAWMPHRWALLGGFLAIFNLGINSYWMNS